MSDVYAKLRWAEKHLADLMDLAHEYLRPGGGDERPRGIQFDNSPPPVVSRDFHHREAGARGGTRRSISGVREEQQRVSFTALVGSAVQVERRSQGHIGSADSTPARPWPEQRNRRPGTATASAFTRKQDSRKHWRSRCPGLPPP
jgi:hypothetical protein